MKAIEIIRSVLDLIDQVECEQEQIPVEQPMEDPIEGFISKLFAEFDADKQGYDNSPDPHVQGVEAVTTAAGGGWNGPKNPADIRADSVSMYPNHQHRPE